MKTSEIIAYHGTTNGDFDSFDKRYINTGLNRRKLPQNHAYGDAVYFSESKQFAENHIKRVQHERQFEGLPYLYTVKIRYQNLLDLRKLFEFHSKELRLNRLQKSSWQFYRKPDLSPVYEELETTKEEIEFMKRFEALTDQNMSDYGFEPKQGEISALLKENGYDLVMTEFKEVLVYDPKQIQIIEKVSLRELHRNRLEQLEKSASPKSQDRRVTITKVR